MVRLLQTCLCSILAAIGSLGAVLAHAQEPQAPRPNISFEVSRSAGLSAEPFTGRVYLFFSRKENQEPRAAMRFISSEPILAKDVQNWKEGEPLTLSLEDAGVICHPRNLAVSDLIGMRVQAIVRLNSWDPQVNLAEGNAYSDVGKVETLDGSTIRLSVSQKIPPYGFKKEDRRQEFVVKSPLLSKFYGREVVMRAAIILPEKYADSDKVYPVIFQVPGFGGTHHYAQPLTMTSGLEVEFVQVLLDASCPTGHHVFADSENNGPWGTALVEDFLPAFEKSFRVVKSRHGRFVMGHSSGGWSSLWLQLSHVETFAGVWSLSPDPIDFVRFQDIDIYEPGQNVFHDGKGMRRPISVSEKRGPVVLFEDLSDLEHALGRGGQLGSFEAVFGPKGSNGLPVPMWDWKTGVVDPAVVEHWKRYDIHRWLTANWPKEGERLKGRIHIHMDDHDNFLLETALKKMMESKEPFLQEMEIVIHPGWGHGSYLKEEFRRKIGKEMADAFLRESGQGR
ncbi:MAG: alpha/beta hydrolase-fold protein [Planctomycetaceae bacterium]